MAEGIIVQNQVPNELYERLPLLIFHEGIDRLISQLKLYFQEHQVKKLKRFLEGWRMAILPLKSVILWEQQWHPLAIVVSVSFFFFIIWLIDLNSIATLAVFGLILNFIDFIVPVICNSLYGPSSWTGQHEKMFEDICKSMVTSYNKGLHNIRMFYSLRETSPCMVSLTCEDYARLQYCEKYFDCIYLIFVYLLFQYYIISITVLCTLAWIASTMNNIFLVYLLSIVMLLWPGLRSKGVLNMILSLVNMAPKAAFLKSE